MLQQLGNEGRSGSWGAAGGDAASQVAELGEQHPGLTASVLELVGESFPPCSGPRCSVHAGWSRRRLVTCRRARCGRGALTYDPSRTRRRPEGRMPTSTSGPTCSGRSSRGTRRRPLRRPRQRPSDRCRTSPSPSRPENLRGGRSRAGISSTVKTMPSLRAGSGSWPTGREPRSARSNRPTTCDLPPQGRRRADQRGRQVGRCMPTIDFMSRSPAYSWGARRWRRMVRSGLGPMVPRRGPWALFSRATKMSTASRSTRRRDNSIEAPRALLNAMVWFTGRHNQGFHFDEPGVASGLGKGAVLVGMGMTSDFLKPTRRVLEGASRTGRSSTLRPRPSRR